MPADFPEDIPLTMEEHVQKAVDCYNAGATVLHLHVRELDGKGSKRLSKFNELIAGICARRCPDMILQVGGSISFAPESEGEAAKWLSDDTRHMLAELKPDARPGDDRDQHQPDEHRRADVRRRPRRHVDRRARAVPRLPRDDDSRPARSGSRSTSAGCPRTASRRSSSSRNITQLETVERMMRRGTCNVPLILTWVAIGGGCEAPNIYNLGRTSCAPCRMARC